VNNVVVNVDTVTQALRVIPQIGSRKLQQLNACGTLEVIKSSSQARTTRTHLKPHDAGEISEIVLSTVVSWLAFNEASAHGLQCHRRNAHQEYSQRRPGYPSVPACLEGGVGGPRAHAGRALVAARAQARFCRWDWIGDLQLSGARKNAQRHRQLSCRFRYFVQSIWVFMDNLP
jgi:hypothetical protein